MGLPLYLIALMMEGFNAIIIKFAEITKTVEVKFMSLKVTEVAVKVMAV